MIEKDSLSYSLYQKKITSYLDGALSQEERSEFEAFVRTHPEFEALIKNKEDELALLRSLIPAVRLSQDASDSLENEMRTSVFNLLKEEPKNFREKMASAWEDWINR
jgi:anti-sigma-K factor RskA